MAMATKTCNTCSVELPVGDFATFYSKSRDKTITENRCRVCKNVAGKLIMREKSEAKKKARDEARAAEAASVAPVVAVSPKPVLSKEQLATQEAKKQASRQAYEASKGTPKFIERAQRNKEYKQNNKDKINATRRKYLKEKMKDPVQRLSRSMKTLLLAKIKKNASSTTYFGTNMQLILKWMEFNFEQDMNWENYGKLWQIDHTIAVYLWDVTQHDEALKCFSWKNLMPLYADRNLRKATHLQPFRIFVQEQRLRQFCKANDVEEDIDEYIKSYSAKFRSLLPEFYTRHTSIAGISSKA